MKIAPNPSQSILKPVIVGPDAGPYCNGQTVGLEAESGSSRSVKNAQG